MEDMSRRKRPLPRPSARKWVVVCLLAWGGAVPCRALTLSSEAPGNLFVTGAPLRFTLKEASGAVSVTLRDYFGRTVARSPAAANAGGVVELPAAAAGG